jgi:secreted trypsin-like serine protease
LKQIFLKDSKHLYLFMNPQKFGASWFQPQKQTLEARSLGRIVGGQEARPHSWPWMVFLDFNGSSCGATLIHPKYILTAVHCVYRKPLPKIVIGAHDKTDRGNLQGRAKRIILFPQVR